MYEKKPWLKLYQHVPKTLDYPRVTMYEAVRQSANSCLDSISYDFLDYTSTYRQFISEIDKCADALAAIGLKKGERITISMPTSPQGIICFYAANKLGAVSSMIHPLSTIKEIEFYLNVAKSRFVLTLDAFYSKFKDLKETTPLETLILARIPDYLGPISCPVSVMIKQSESGSPSRRMDFLGTSRPHSTSGQTGIYSTYFPRVSVRNLSSLCPPS